jgi:hypothetical protein
MTLRKTFLCAASAALAACCARSAARADVTFPLFDGQSLSGWTLVHDARFSVKDGALNLDGGMGWLRTDHRYRDFTLSVEWRALGDAYDSGFFFRAPLDGKPWPKGYQVNLRHDEVGKLVGVDGAGGPTQASVKPRGEWNRFELTVKGKEASLKINGADAWKTQALEERDGFIGIQAEVHKFQFRSFQLTEIGYTDLSEGLSGGKGKHLVVRGAGTWEAKPGGLLVNSGEGGGWLGTLNPEWSDFSVKLEYKVPKDGNSGVFLRCPLQGNPAYEGLEVQVIDDDATRWQLREWQHTGAIYGVVPPSRRATRSAGTWESMEITARGSRIAVHVNGFEVVNANLDEHDQKAGDVKSLKDRPRQGYIGLQSYGTGVEVKDFRVKKLEG